MAKFRRKSVRVNGGKAKGVSFEQSNLTAHIAVANSRAFGGFGGMSFNGWLPNPDPVLKKLGRDIEVYRELLVDPIVGGHVRRRKASVAGMEYRLLNDDVPANVTELIESMLAGLDVYRFINDVLEASMFGYQPIEVLWAQDGVWLPEALLAKPQEWFQFNNEGMLCFIGQGAQTEPVPEYKFLCPTQSASYTNPYGQGDLSMVYWPTVFKRAGLKFWARFTEKYGTPWIIGKEPRSNTPTDTNKLLDSLEALMGDAVGSIPNDSSVEILEASGKSSSVEAFEQLIRYCRSEIAIALLGQDMSTEHSSTNASANAGLEVTNDIRDQDCRMVEACFNQLIDWVCTLNFGEDVMRPKFELYEEEQVDKLLAERDKILTECGVQFTSDYFMRTYNFKEGDLTLAQQLSVLKPRGGLPDHVVDQIRAGEVSFGEPAKSFDLTDELADLMPSAADLNKQTDSMLRAVIERLQNVSSDEEALAILAQAYPEMDSESLQNELTKMLFIGQVLSRLDTEDELK